MKPLIKISTFLLLVLLMSCNNDDSPSNDPEEPEELVFEIFDVDPLTYKQYDVPQTNPDWTGVAVYAWAVFDKREQATNYKLTYECTTAPHLSFEISWKPGEAIPPPGAALPEVVPGYEKGLIGNQYYISILTSGCQGTVGGTCVVGGVTPNKMEENMRNIEGKVTVEIDYE